MKVYLKSVKPRVWISAGVVGACIIATSLGYDSWIEAMGLMAGGYLFGSAGFK